MLLISLLIVFSLSWVTLDSVPQPDECGGPLSNIEFDDILGLCDYYARCTQPINILNVNCILTSCPMLKGVCPMYSNGSVNNDASVSAVAILNACIGQDILICGINMSHTPMVQLGWTTKNLLPTNVVNGTLNLNPGSRYLDNLSGANFTLIQTDNPVGTVSLFIQAPNITNKSHFTGTFNLTENSFIEPFKRQLTTPNTPNTLSTPNVFATYDNDVSCLIAIDLSSTPTPTIHILDDQSDIEVVFSNFVSSNDDVFLLPSLVTLFNQKMQNFVKNSQISSTAINFLSTYMAQGLKAAQFNCHYLKNIVTSAI